MTDVDGALPTARPVASVPEPFPAPADAALANDASSAGNDDCAMRRAALRDLAALTGVEVFY